MNHRHNRPARAGALKSLLAAASASAIALFAGAPAHAATPKTRVAIIVRDFGNPYWRALRDGAVAEGKKLHIPVSVQAGATETDSIGENAKISTMANEDFTCFGVVPVNATNIITPLIPVSNKHIPIINLDSGLDPAAVKAAGLTITSFIGSDNTNAGQIAGAYMLKMLHDKGNVAILQGIPGEENGINRDNAFRSTTAGKLTVVQAEAADYERSRALTEAEAMLRVHPDLNGIFAANDEMGLGAAQAIANAGKSATIKVVSIDGVKEALESVKSGKLSGTVSQYPYAEGEMAVQACHQLAMGKSIPAHVTAPIKLITPQNAAKALKSFPRPFFTFTDPFGTP
ncbi:MULTISPECIES: sugar ABC transporter substrate-binding protein [Acidiphilium]|uniref:Ribose transport system substrate-binding protein n=1 Tax=Acidiphilium rubrum TaxID=526 RepID=A0A8G2CL45_ACIRU|nr:MULTISPECIES: substrate-binding domain-containing protein [Acidiphilium]SIQ93564.1 ribose transport system substrate-binding protein [Acidiphilium rubrum]